MGEWKKAQYLTEDMLKAIEQELDKGMFEKYVYQLLEIPVSTWQYWKKEAKKLEAQLDAGEITSKELQPDDFKILRFLAICKKGRAKAIQKNLQNIQNAGEDPKTWHASAWFLERTCPDEYGRKQKITHEGIIGSFDMELTDKDKAKFQDNLAAIYGGEEEEDEV